jgi:hypothetical protein
MSLPGLVLALIALAGPPGALPLVPPGPTAGDLAEGWASDLETLRPRPDERVPWLKSATAARLFLHALPSDDAEARPRIVEAVALLLARHGRTFEQPAWDGWFRAQAWYHPRPDYSPRLLSEGEREALDRLLQAWQALAPRGPVR